MRNLDELVLKRTASFIERRGKLVTYLRYQRSAGPNPALTLLEERSVRAMVAPYPQNLINGTLVQAQDIQVQVAALRFPFRPALTDVLVIDGRRYSVVSVAAENAIEQVAKWVLQARGSN